MGGVKSDNKEVAQSGSLEMRRQFCILTHTYDKIVENYAHTRMQVKLVKFKVCSRFNTLCGCGFPALVMNYSYVRWYTGSSRGKGAWDLCTIFATSCECIIISKQKV